MQAVPNQFPKGDGTLAIVGEAPGKDEAVVGRPFVGASGAMLMAVLKRHGLSRSDVFIGNVCQLNPPGNNLALWFRGGSANPNWQFIANGRNQLLNDLGKLNNGNGPNCILALGNFAMWALLGVGSDAGYAGWTGIARYRGAVYTMQLHCANGKTRTVKVIPSFHPAYCLKMWKWGAILQRDVKKALRESKDPSYSKPIRNVHIANNTGDLQRFFEILRAAKEIGSDIECDREHRVTCIGFSPDPQNAYVVPLRGNGGWLWTPEVEAYIWGQIQTVYDAVPEVCFQNGMFDRTVLARGYGITVPRFTWDTMLAARVLSPEFPAGLDFLASVYTDEPFWKDDGKEWMDPSNWQQFYEYNGKDCMVMHEIWHRQREECADDPDHAETIRYSMSTQDPFLCMNLRGIKRDVDAAQRHKERLTTEIAVLTDVLCGVLGGAFNPGSPDQTKTLLYNVLKLPPQTTWDSTKREQRISADEAAVLQLRAKFTDDPVLDLILGIRKRQKALSTFVEMTPDADGRLRGTLQLGTETGRVSCKQTLWNTGGNLQTIPPDLRDMFVPDDGLVMINADYSAAEEWVRAFDAEDEPVIERLLSGGDAHKFGASKVFQKPESEITPDERSVSKRIVHGTNYKMGPHIMQRTLAKFGYFWSFAQVRNAQDNYLRESPIIARWQTGKTRLLSSGDPTIRNPFGRKRTFYSRPDDKDTIKEALATLPQGTVADLLGRAMRRIYDELYPRVEILLHVHDSLLLQCKPEDVDWAIAEIRKRMLIPITIHGRTFTIPVDASSGNNWKEAK